MPPFINRKRDAHSPSPPASSYSKRAKRSSPVEKRVSGRGTHQPTRKNHHTVFDLVDSSKPSSSNAPAGKIFVDVDDSEGSSSSDADSDDFEDVVPSASENNKSTESDDDAAEGWEDALPTPLKETHPSEYDMPTGPIEITLDAQEPEVTYEDLTGGKKKGPSKQERRIRDAAHRMHVQFLMWHNYLRNHWANDEGVQGRLVGHLRQSEKMQVRVDTWRRRSGLIALSPPQDASRNATAGRSTAKTRGKARGGGSREKKDDGRGRRDWAEQAQRQAFGEADMSRGDPIISLLNTLSSWWRQRFTITAPCLRKRGYKPMRAIKQEMQAWRKGKSDVKEHGEKIADLKEFRSCAARCEGSRDVGAQLFVALLRGLGVEARLVASLQPLGFGFTKIEDAEPRKYSVSHSKPNGKVSNTEQADKLPKKEISAPKALASSTIIELSDTSDLSEIEFSDSSDASIVDITPKKKANIPYDNDLFYPNYWIEVVSPVTHRVFPVDPFILRPPVATSAEQLAAFEVRGAKSERARQVFAYIVAFSPDNSAKDVTVRYLKKHMWPGRTKGMRMSPSKIPIRDRHGNLLVMYEFDWWQNVMRGYCRPPEKRTKVDEIEDEAELRAVKPEKKLPKEGPPETLDGYKRSDKYVLERHLRREEALLPDSKPVRTFQAGKGDKAKDEPVFLRKDVVICRTSESWHKEGRQIKFGEQPLKMVKVRAVTLNRKREIEEVERQSGEKATQGMYGIEQTEYIIPPPIKDGVIPKNAYGNMDAFVPQMIPEGAAHIPLRGTKRVCNKLDIDFAEAVTGFEFGNKMAVPVIQGVVVAEENRERVIALWKQMEEERKAREEAKREKEVLSTWRKFLMGLRVLKRMQAEYEVQMDDDLKETNPFLNRKKAVAAEEAITPVTSDRNDSSHKVERLVDGGFIQGGETTGGGFFHEGYHGELPKDSHNSMINMAVKEDELKIEHEHGTAINPGMRQGKAMSLADLAAKKAALADASMGEHEQGAIKEDEQQLPKPESKTGVTKKTHERRTTRESAPVGNGKQTLPAQRARTKNERVVPARQKRDTALNRNQMNDIQPKAASMATPSRRASTRTAARASQQRIRSHFFEKEEEQAGSTMHDGESPSEEDENEE